MSELDRLLGPDLVAALESLVDSRVAAALESRDNGNGGNPWFGIADAAGYLGVSPRTITRLLDQNRIHSVYVGRRRLLHRDDLDQHLRGDAER